MQKIYYAGIGSRETPEPCLGVMRQVASYLEREGWILRSGGARGADIAFEEGIQSTPNKEIYLPWAGYNNSGSSLNPKNHPFTQSEQDFTAHFHPAWNKCSPSAKLLHCRNTRIMLGCEAVHGPVVKASLFVLCWTAYGAAAGGTGQALRIAQAHGIPIFNLGKAMDKQGIEDILLEMDEYQIKLKKELL